jgi:hypothetical protein
MAGLQRVIFSDQSMLTDFSLNGKTSKSFKSNDGVVRLCYQDWEICLETDQVWWGIWNNRGGWPGSDAPAGFCSLAIEATNCDSNFPKNATVLPDGNFKGTVSLKIVQ